MPSFEVEPSTSPDRSALLAELSGARVVVTGATGFIGQHVMQALTRVGAQGIAVVDRAHANRSPASADSQPHIFDDPMEIAALVSAQSPDYVIHLYAEITTQRSIPAIESTLRRNLLPSVALMEACVGSAVRRMILMGSGEEFGPVTGPFDDSTIPEPALAVWRKQGGDDLLRKDVLPRL